MPSPDRELTPARLAAVLAGATMALLSVAAAVYGFSVAWHDGPHLGTPVVTATTASSAPPADAAAATSTTSTTAAPVPRPADPSTYEIAVSDCRQNGADVRIVGFVGNRTPGPVAFRITAAAIGGNGDVLASGTTDTAPIAAGGRADWEVRTTSAVQLPDVGAHCDVRSVAALPAA